MVAAELPVVRAQGNLPGRNAVDRRGLVGRVGVLFKVAESVCKIFRINVPLAGKINLSGAARGRGSPRRKGCDGFASERSSVRARQNRGDRQGQTFARLERLVQESPRGVAVGGDPSSRNGSAVACPQRDLYDLVRGDLPDEPNRDRAGRIDPFAVVRGVGPKNDRRRVLEVIREEIEERPV